MQTGNRKVHTMQDNVVKYLIRACLLVREQDSVGRMKTASLRVQLRRAGFSLVALGGSRACVVHKRTQRMFKVERYRDTEGYDNEREWVNYHTKFYEWDKRYFAKPIALHWEGRVMETTPACGVKASEYYSDEDHIDDCICELIEEIQERYELFDMHIDNYFVIGSSVIIVDYAC